MYIVTISQAVSHAVCYILTVICRVSLICTLVVPMFPERHAKIMEEGGSQLVLQTAPFDARFPYTNQTKNCWQNFVDFHRCSKKLGEEHESCKYFKRVYTSLCPKGWVSAWLFLYECYLLFFSV